MDPMTLWKISWAIGAVVVLIVAVLLLVIIAAARSIDKRAAEIWTVGGTMGGNCEIGRSGIEIAPASVISTATTVAKIGRSMKKATRPGGLGPGASFSGGAPNASARASVPRAVAAASAHDSAPSATLSPMDWLS